MIFCCLVPNIEPISPNQRTSYFGRHSGYASKCWGAYWEVSEEILVYALEDQAHVFQLTHIITHQSPEPPKKKKEGNVD